MKVLVGCLGLVLLLAGLVLGAPASQSDRSRRNVDVVQIDQEKLAELKEKLENLKAVLEKLALSLNQLPTVGGGDEEQSEEARRALEDSASQVEYLETDPVVKDYVAHLSDEDQAVVRKMSSKAKFIQALLNEKELGPGLNPEDDGEAVEGDKRSLETQAGQGEEAREVEQLLGGLSEEDRALLKNQEEKWKYIKRLLADGAAKKAENSINDEDKKQLKLEKDHINNLENEVASYKRRLAESAGVGDDDCADDPCACKPGEVNCDCNKRPTRCQKPPSLENASKMSTRLVEDLRQAREQGVSLNDLVEALRNTAKQAYGEADEQELTQLAARKKRVVDQEVQDLLMR